MGKSTRWVLLHCVARVVGSPASLERALFPQRLYRPPPAELSQRRHRCGLRPSTTSKMHFWRSYRRTLPRHVLKLALRLTSVRGDLPPKGLGATRGWWMWVESRTAMIPDLEAPSS